MEQQQAFETGRFLGLALIYILIGLVLLKILKAFWRVIRRKERSKEVGSESSRKMSGRVLFILLIVILISAFFYWFQVRPAQIKHDCSWVEVDEKAIPAKSALSEEELKEKGMLLDCTKSYQSVFINNAYKSICESNNQRLIEEYKVPREAIPGKSWWREASPKEYQFCLHNKGL